MSQKFLGYPKLIGYVAGAFVIVGLIAGCGGLNVW